MIGMWSGTHYGCLHDEPALGVCGEGFRLQVSRCGKGLISGIMKEDVALAHSAVSGSWNGGCVRFSKRRRMFLVEHERTVISLENFLIIRESTLARYHILEPAFQYEGWYDPAHGEIRGRWFWPGFHCETQERGSWLQIGAMRGLWRMTKEEPYGFHARF